ncbi:MAG: hypothetical protein CO013_11535 [Syntrophobacterales bacterium CG_4_8_14_3_um_filter_58_8]|nr:MAG: hypothetical protein AUK26_08810 [Syntrophaceae bacterium CG2_30_58_14]PIV04672.1 MAG: hypothetical protein COS57_08450 [Syntrophobacterales bacterium CG03_land_8_20_14_0_80_58_14]PJC72015.1 MAG: hypothetical protein CO013_11535 [Syntrophobacterales bacterium CG_4_8_14_3_um_filter_58_8]
MDSSKVKNAQESSFRLKPESRNFNMLQKTGHPVFTGVATFDESVKIKLDIGPESPYKGTAA